jgi:hypothetical protein
MSDDDVTTSVSALKTISQIFSVLIIVIVSFKNGATGNLKRFSVSYYKLQKSEYKNDYRERCPCW